MNRKTILRALLAVVLALSLLPTLSYAGDKDDRDRDKDRREFRDDRDRDRNDKDSDRKDFREDLGKKIFDHDELFEDFGLFGIRRGGLLDD